MSADSYDEMIEAMAEEAEYLQLHSDKVYTVIGEFIIKFENLCHNLDWLSERILEISGLDNKRVQEVILNSANSTAGQKLELARKLYKAAFEKDYQNANELIFSKIGEIIKERNRLIHSSWNFGHDENSGEFGIFSSKPVKGASKKEIAVHKMEKTFSKDIADLTKRVSPLHFYIFALFHNLQSENPSERIHKIIEIHE